MGFDNDMIPIELNRQLVSPSSAGWGDRRHWRGEKSFTRHVKTIRRYRLTILVGLILGACGGASYRCLYPAHYRSSAVVSLGSDLDSLQNVQHLGLPPSVAGALPLERKLAVIKSPGLAEAILSRNPDVAALVRAEDKPSGESDIPPGNGVKGRSISASEAASYLKRISFIPQPNTSLVTISAVWADPLIANKIASLHTQGVIDNLREQQRRLIDDVLVRLNGHKEELDEKYLEILTTERRLRTELDASAKDQQKQSQLMAELTIIQNRGDATRQSLSSINQMLESVSLHADKDLRNVSVIEPASPNFSPISPSIALFLGAGGVAGLIIGIAIALLREASDPTIHSISDCADQLELPVIGAIPNFSPDTRKAITNFKTKPRSRRDRDTRELRNPQGLFGSSRSSASRGSAPVLIAAPFSPESESIRAFAAALTHQCLSVGQQIILFASTGIDEGKSSLAANTAIALAEMHKRTLLIDADLRFPSIHHMFGMDITSGGLFDFALGGGELQDHFVQGPGENLTLLLSGSPAPLPVVTSDHELIHAGLRGVTPLFDAVIIDSPPLGLVADTVLLSTMAHAVVLVARFGQTTVERARRGLEQLRQVDANVVGIALNGVSGELG